MKKINCLLFVAGFSLLTSSLFAQLENFDLSKYKVADYKRQELNFNFQTNGTNYSSKFKSAYDTINSTNENFNIHLSAGYNNYLNTRKQQQTISLNAGINPFNYDFQKNYNSYLPRTNKRFAYSFNALIDKKLYNSNNFFFGISNSTEYYYSRSKLKEKEVINSSQIIKRDNIDKYQTLHESISFSIGQGRIEYVEDARMAVFILDDLLKNNKLERQPTEDEILEFSSRITQLKNKRFFDTRIRKKYEIQAIDSFLQKNKLTNSQDAIYFVSLFDNWNYSNSPQRQFGSRISLNYNPYLHYFTVTDPSPYYSSDLNHKIYFEFTYAKPLNLKWQRDISTSLGFIHNYYRNSSYNWKSDWFIVDVNLKYGFYPNSRSYYTFNLYTSAQRVLKTKDNIASFAYSLYAGLNAYYFISERFQLNASAKLGYNYNLTYFEPQNQTKYVLNPSFSIYLTYNLF